MQQLIPEEVGAQLVIFPRTVDHTERLRQKPSVNSARDVVPAVGPEPLDPNAGPRTAAPEEAR